MPIRLSQVNADDGSENVDDVFADIEAVESIIPRDAEASTKHEDADVNMAFTRHIYWTVRCKEGRVKITQDLIVHFTTHDGVADGQRDVKRTTKTKLKVLSGKNRREVEHLIAMHGWHIV